ncbi:pyridoxamine 5'-phosphate oxidase family protein [Tenacibaculum sp. IB213877]|uniref:pyridoxamine 5'-phosphate oxidase family protein n=1 Tax=Tenacibaculum sp. IB213877 TaxID=3097351 RepID=UPI002A5A8E16|nr:pyridoxamine 5'-phosphate oxidase family protein [Tenacibaculum sp. IB213877]MDY0780128.1 pyridoxamine 5'-phosphate oxidase family protein [Tenacibaculum sp. IB213877]
METKNKIDALKTFKDLAENIDFTLMSTNLSQFPFHTVPMSTKKVDENGNIWFLSGRNSMHNVHIKQSPEVHLSYAKPGDMEFLAVCGHAEIMNSPSIIEELYGKSDDMWFDGKNDPNVSVIKVKPHEVSYWDTKDNKLVSLLKAGYAFIVGSEPDTIEKGTIDF